MNREIAEQWAAELESGKWKQGKGKLREGKCFCCIGVLVQLAIRSGVQVRTETGGGYFDAGGYLPLMQWSGMRDVAGWLPNENMLTVLNDEGKTFPEIAAIIREHADEL